MDGKSEVWTCSLTRFVWHLLLFRSWIACIGFPLPLIVSFFEDCYKPSNVQERKDQEGEIRRDFTLLIFSRETIVKGKSCKTAVGGVLPKRRKGGIL